MVNARRREPVKRYQIELFVDKYRSTPHSIHCTQWLAPSSAEIEPPATESTPPGPTGRDLLLRAVTSSIEHGTAASSGCVDRLVTGAFTLPVEPDAERQPDGVRTVMVRQANKRPSTMNVARQSRTRPRREDRARTNFSDGSKAGNQFLRSMELDSSTATRRFAIVAAGRHGAIENCTKSRQLMLSAKPLISFIPAPARTRHAVSEAEAPAKAVDLVDLSDFHRRYLVPRTKSQRRFNETPNSKALSPKLLAAQALARGLKRQCVTS